MGCMARGGSSPLERMAKAPPLRGFLLSGGVSSQRERGVRNVATGKPEHISEHLRPPRRRGGQRSAMSISYAKDGWEVRWRDSTGRQRAKRFREEVAARAFVESIRELPTGERARGRHGQAGGVYPYATRAGNRWRYVVRRSDGSMTSKRGFMSESAARDARRRMVEQVVRREAGPDNAPKLSRIRRSPHGAAT